MKKIKLHPQIEMSYPIGQYQSACHTLGDLKKNKWTIAPSCLCERLLSSFIPISNKHYIVSGTELSMLSFEKCFYRIVFESIFRDYHLQLNTIIFRIDYA